MSTRPSNFPERSVRAGDEGWRGRPEPAGWDRGYGGAGTGMGTGLLIAGAVAVGLGLLAWNYLGPDLRRYLKIRSM
jgi:hypothetical protein